MKLYRIINRYSAHWVQVKAHSAQEACQSQGWDVAHCFTLELPLPPGQGRQSITQDELDYLKDCQNKWDTSLTIQEAAECIRILQKWVDAQNWQDLLNSTAHSP